MPPKSANKGGGKAGNASASSKAKSQQNREEDLQREPLQAVVLADAFSKRLDPLTADKPACLLPLCNVPLLDWTLENLALAEVEEIFILASRHSDKIKKHLATSPARYSLPKITVLATPDAQSLGDVMRELDSKQIIRSDFILIHADSVASMDLASIVDAHKRRRKKDKDAIMTICTMPVGKRSRIRTPGNLSLFFVEPHTSQLVHYAPVRAAPRLRTTTLPLEVFDEDAAATTHSLSRGAEVDIRNDLVDCGIDICSATYRLFSPRTSITRPSAAISCSAFSPRICWIARSLCTLHQLVHLHQQCRLPARRSLRQWAPLPTVVATLHESSRQPTTMLSPKMSLDNGLTHLVQQATCQEDRTTVLALVFVSSVTTLCSVVHASLAPTHSLAAHRRSAKRLLFSNQFSDPRSRSAVAPASQGLISGPTLSLALAAPLNAASLERTSRSLTVSRSTRVASSLKAASLGPTLSCKLTAG